MNPSSNTSIPADAQEQFLANLANLVALWHALGADEHKAADSEPLFQSRSWPHRLWIEPSLVEAEARTRAAQLARAAASEHGIIVPTWLPPGVSSHASREGPLAQGLEQAFGQTVMNAALGETRDDVLQAPKLDFVEGSSVVQEWTETAARSFGYAIDPEPFTLLSKHPDAHFVLARREGRSVGTGLLFATGRVAGIHMVGVPPEARRSGIAGAMMIHLHKIARECDLRTAALQASDMGEGLYRKLGYEAYGRIENFAKRPSAESLRASEGNSPGRRSPLY
jgi:ribosomal protein S18 acetylase RimI-like enzyme